MIIKQLNLISFGKFQDKELVFSPGFNIIEGENEVGKTTIHKFIEGMFYGFLDPTKSRRSYSDDHKKYQPKNATDYRGSMILSIKGKDYRIERNFDKKQADVIIYDNANGQDVTSNLDIHPTLKMPDIGSFIGLSYKLFQNTVSISQLLRNTEKDLGQALVEKLHNITTTKDESISIRTIQEALNKQLMDIGSEKAKTKPLAKAVSKVDKLKGMIQESTDKYNESERLFSEKQHKVQERSGTEERLTEVTEDIHQYNNTKKKEQYNKALAIKELMDKNTIKITANEEKLTLEEKVYERLQEIHNQLGYLAQKEADAKTEENDLKDQQADIKNIIDQHKSFTNQAGVFYQLRDRYYSLESKKEELQRLRKQENHLSNELANTSANQQLIEDHKVYEQEKSTLEESPLYLYEKDLDQARESLEKLEKESPSKWILYLSYVLFPLIIGFILYKKQKEKLTTYKQKVERQLQIIAQAEEAFTLAKKEHEAKKSHLQRLLDKHHVSSSYEFSEQRRIEDNNVGKIASLNKELEQVKEAIEQQEKAIKEEKASLKNLSEKLDTKLPSNQEELNQLEQDIRLHQNKVESNQVIEEKLKKISATLNQISTQKQALNKELNELLDNSNCTSIEDYKQGLTLKQELVQIQKENAVMLDRMHDLTEGLSIETYKESIDFQLTDYQKSDGINDLEKRQSSLRTTLRDIEARIYELDKDIALIEETYKDVYTLEAMLDKAQEELQVLQDQKAATTLASEVIDELAKEIQYEFAPSLNTAISGIMSSITDGKYKDLKIDQDTNIKILDEYLKQLLDTEDFSTGTIDQIYFSMRLGLSKILFKEDFPYIFDDTFVNYDATRLTRVLQLLEKEHTQILLFTCHKREHLIAKAEDLTHTYLNLS